MPYQYAKERNEPLFKFRVFNPERDQDPNWLGYAASLLRDGVIYCASPHELNDPWEGRPAFDLIDSQKNPIAAKLFTDEFIAAQPPDVVRADVEQWLNRVGYHFAARAMQDAHWENGKERSFYCVAGNPVEPLMWSHYANGHQGLCWVFDQAKFPFFGAIKMEYSENCPSIDWSRWKELDLIRLSHLVKAKFWSHEDEYRIMIPATPSEKFPTVPYAGSAPAPLGKFLKIDREGIIGVIFGAGMSIENRKAINRLAKEYYPDLELYAAGLHRREYKMVVRPLAEDELRILEE
ncbi:MAG: DUF2971 domain-containing protein [Steroidobacteraceae bacterium]